MSVCVHACEWVCAGGRKMTWFDLWLRRMVLGPCGEGRGKTTSWNTGSQWIGSMGFKAQRWLLILALCWWRRGVCFPSSGTGTGLTDLLGQQNVAEVTFIHSETSIQAVSKLPPNSSRRILGGKNPGMLRLTCCGETQVSAPQLLSNCWVHKPQTTEAPAVKSRALQQRVIPNVHN